MAPFENIEKKCTLFISSHDDYDDLWEGFFCCLRKYWPGLNLPIVLVSESKKCVIPDFDIKSLNLYRKGSKVPWGKRTIEALNRVGTEFVLFMADDFWLDDYVDYNRFQECLNLMEQNYDIACICFEPSNLCCIDDNLSPDLLRLPKKGEYRIRAQIAIWRRKKLIRYIRKHESIWDFEVLGSKRSERYSDRFYSIKKSVKPIFSWPSTGVIFRGKWYSEELIDKYIEEFDLKIDESVRGIYEEPERIPKEPFIERLKKPDLIGRIIRRIKRRITVIKSLI